MANARRRFSKEERAYLRELVLRDLEKNKELSVFALKPINQLLEKLTSIEEALK